MAKPLWHPVERLRRIWTPERELYERTDALDPASELDSQIRDWFCRTVRKYGPLTLDVTDRNDGFIRWELIETATGRREVSVWWLSEPEEDS